MTIKSRTIDNLGVDASIRYARDKELFEPKLIDDAKVVSQKTGVSAATPHLSLEMSPLFSLGRPLPWASFTAPPQILPDFVFSYQLIPSLGGYESTEEDVDPKDLIQAALAKKGKDPDEEKEKRESKTLVLLLEYIAKIDRSIALINARRNQYQRG